jgi:phosphoglycolate phosphatase-like HAD superfamily hydrolase
MQKIKAIIFDLDGTIADTLPLCILAFRNSVEPLINHSISDEEIIATFGPSEEGTIIALAPQHYERGVADYLYQYEILHNMCPQPFEGIKELLAFLQNKSVHVAMVTGKGKYSTDISLKYFDIKNFFEIIETGSPLGPIKAKGIQTILDQWPEISKDEVVYVGDSAGDIEAARKTGIPIIAASRASTADSSKLKQLQPDELFYTITDFSNWVYSKL